MLNEDLVPLRRGSVLVRLSAEIGSGRRPVDGS